MKLSLCSDVSGMSFLGSVEVADVLMTPCDLDTCQPFVRALAPANTKIAAFIMGWLFSLILLVLRTSCLAKIAPFVIYSIAINVIYAISRPIPRDEQPSESVCEIEATIETDALVSVGSCRTCDCPSLAANTAIATENIHSPSENTFLGIVVKQLAQSFCGYNRLSHEVPVKLIDQRPAQCYKHQRAFAY